MKFLPHDFIIKPKLWMNPLTHEIWRLMPIQKANGTLSYRGACYESIGTIDPIEIHFMEQTVPLTYTKRPFPSDDFKIVPLVIEGISRTHPKDAVMISRYQFFCLYEAVASSASWWPMCDLQWNVHNLFEYLELYGLYYKKMLVGFGALQRYQHPFEISKLMYLGMIPAYQNTGLGGMLFESIMQKAWQAHTQKVILDTVPQYDLMKDGTPAADYYKRKGFVLVETHLCSQDDTIQPNQLNLPKFYANHPAYYESYLLQRLILAFHC
ncbi:MAG: GNAT family N-acetyltransferase [Alphaproteobacteria bacterium]|nr:GNAT family N-acetyltransferase [Alphaproteobacteria bacterium]